MKTSGYVMPNASFSVIRLDDAMAQISFFEDVKEVPCNNDDRKEDTMWEYNQYLLIRPYYDMIETDISNNYQAWLECAKMQEEIDNPPDVPQLRADVDYQSVMLSVMSPMSLASNTEGSDDTVLNLAWKYYPIRWSEDRLRVLVMAQKLTEADFEKITGKPYNEEVVV